jgi:transposase
VRAREAATKDQLRARHRLSKFLLRHGVRPPAGVRAWTAKHRSWLEGLALPHPALDATLLDYRTEVDHARERVVRLEQAIQQAVLAASVQMRAVIAALQALRGLAQLAAVTIVTEVGSLSRFARPAQLMGYSGAVPSERSSGGKTCRGGITKTGNAHLRRIVIEAAWAYRHRPAIGPTLRRRQAGVSDAVKAIAWKAQHRLHARYRRLVAKDKPAPQVVTAIARELLGFIWAVGLEVERTMPTPARAAA